MAKVDELVIELRAKTGQFESAMGNAGKQTSQFESVAKRAQQAAIALVGAMSFREVVQYSDSYKLLNSQLALVTKSTEELAMVQKQTFDIAQESRIPLEAVINLYARLQRSTSTLGYTQEEVRQVTETLSKATIVSGASATEASNAIIQLSQGLAAGALRGDEFRSVSEQLPVILDIIAEHTGKTRGELRAMAEQGEITAKLIMDALGGAADDIDGKFSKMSVTVGQAMTQLNNAFLQFIGQSEAANNGTSALAMGISSLAKNLDTVATVALGFAGIMAARVVSSIVASTAAFYTNTTAQLANQAMLARTSAVYLGLAGSAGTATGATAGLTAAMRALGITPIGVALTAAAGAMIYFSGKTNEAEAATAAHEEVMQRARIITLELANASGERVKSLQAESDQIIKTAIDEVNAIQARIDAMQKLTTANALTVSRTGMTPTEIAADEISDESENLIRASKRLNELLDELHKPRPQASIPRINTSNGAISVSTKGQAKEVEREAEEATDHIDKYYDNLEDRTKEAADGSRDMAFAFESAFENAIVSGEDLGDVLNALAQDIAKLIIKRNVTAPLIESIFGGDTGGGFFGDLFAGFRAEGGAVQSGMPYVVGEKRPEIFVPQTSGRIVPSTNGMGGSGVRINIINNTSSRVSAQSSQAADGGMDLRFMIDEAVAQNVATQGSRTNQALKSVMGASLTNR